MKTGIVETLYPKHNAIIKCNETGIDLVALIPSDQIRVHCFDLDIYTTEEINRNGIVVQFDHCRGNRIESRLLSSR